MKGKFWARSLSALLVAVLLSSAITGCKPGDEPDTSSGSSSDTADVSNPGADTESTDSTLSDDSSGEETESTDGSTGTASGGKTSRPGGKPSSTGGGTTKPNNGLPADYKEFVFATSVYVNDYQNVGNNARSDLYVNRFAELEKKYGIDIKIKTYPEADSMVTDIATSVASNTQPFDVLETRNARARQLMAQGIIKPQTDIKAINVKDSRFAQSVAENVTFNKKVYATTIGGVYKAVTGVFFNKEILLSLGLDKNHVYNLYDKKQWTFDSFRKLARDATRVVGGQQIYGVLGTTAPVGHAISANALGTVIRKNGKYDVAMASSAGIEAMKWVHDIWAVDKSMNFINDNVRTWEEFANGTALFFPTWAWYSQYFAEYNMEDEFGFVPFPIGPRQKDYVTNAYEYECFVMPKSLKHPEATGKIYMEIASISSQLEKLFESELSDYGLDDKGIAVYKAIQKNIQPEFSQGVNFTASGDIDSAIFSQNGDPAKVATSMKKQMQTEVDEFYKKIS